MLLSSAPPRKLNSHDINIQIEGWTLEIVKTTKFLGLILDSGLSWKNHIQHITTKIAKSIGILSLAKQTLTQKSLIQLYYAFVFPYCTVIWGKNHDSTIWPIFRLQKNSLRIIGNIPRRQSLKPFCKTQKLLRFPDIYTYSVCIFMYYYTNSLLPDTFKNLFHENKTFHHYPTRNRDKLRPPRTNSKLADNFISKQGAIIWNNLKASMETNTSLPVFKTTLKNQLLSSY
jgi:hypothetical protein